jgi:hypothetical protein
MRGTGLRFLAAVAANHLAILFPHELGQRTVPESTDELNRARVQGIFLIGTGSSGCW